MLIGSRQQLQKVNLNDITVADTVVEATSVVWNLIIIILLLLLLKKKRYSKKYFVNITGQHRVILDGNIKERGRMTFYLFQLIGTQ